MWLQVQLAVLPTLVFVVLPVDTSSADVEALLAACNQTYLDGECRAGSPPTDPANLSAEVRWSNETAASVSLRFDLDAKSNTLSRNLAFQPEDERRERYRALGFAVGSLAGAATELIRTSESRAEAVPLTKPEATPIDPADRGPAPPSVSEPPKVINQTPVPRDLRAQLRAAAELGTGIDGPRWGGRLDVRTLWSQRWVLDVHGAYAVQHSTDPDLKAAFVNAGVGFGFQSHFDSWCAAVTLGPALQQVSAASEQAQGSLRAAWGAELGLDARVPASGFAPFIELRFAWYRHDRVKLVSGQVDVGPMEMRLGLGFVLPDLMLERESHAEPRESGRR